MIIKGKKLQPAVPAKEVEIILEIRCDLCNKVAPDPNDYDGPNWCKEYPYYDKEYVTIEYKHGSRYPEGTNFEIWKYHICPDCFQNKLMPWMKSQNADFTLEDLNF